MPLVLVRDDRSRTAHGRSSIQKPRQIPWMPYQVTRDWRRLRWTEPQFLRGCPLERQVRHCAWFCRRCHCLQRCAQNCQLARHIAWPTQRHAERMFDRRYPWGTCAGCQLGNDRQRDGTESCCLDLTLYQSNGPAAHRSHRDQHHYVNMFLAKSQHDAGHALPQQSLRPKRVAHI